VTANDTLREKVKSSVLSDAIGQLTAENGLPPVGSSLVHLSTREKNIHLTDTVLIALFT
jgi:hypothetical protein